MTAVPARPQPVLPSGLDALFTPVPLDDPAAALPAIPAAAGIGQFLTGDGRNLLIARAANLRRWAATHLGAGPPAKPGKRPPLDLRPVAGAFRHAALGGDFQQRLVFERLMARYVPLASRRDLKPPAWLHLDLAERFPRISVRSGRAARAGGPLFGPFRDARAAGRARDALHKRLPLRPCDYAFEPHPELPLGLGCVYAQTGTCAAPCLQRKSEDDYRTLAGEALALLGGAGDRSVDALPDWVAPRRPLRALVVDPVAPDLIELYPVRDGRVLEAQAVRAPAADVEDALAGLAWPDPAGGDAIEDWPWLMPWLHAPRRKGRYLVLPPSAGGDLAVRVRAALGGAQPR